MGLNQSQVKANIHIYDFCEDTKTQFWTKMGVKVGFPKRGKVHDGVKFASAQFTEVVKRISFRQGVMNLIYFK